MYTIVVEGVLPELDGGRHPVKRLVGDVYEVGADIYRDGHDTIAARIRHRGPGEEEWRQSPLAYEPAEDRWYGSFALDRIGKWHYTVEAWTDRFGTWRGDLEKKVAAGQDVTPELLEGAELIEATARRAWFGEARTALRAAAQRIRDTDIARSARITAALTPELHALVETHYVPDDVTVYDKELELYVDRPRAGFAAWYELFPRSQSLDPKQHGTFDDAARRIPRLAELGYDVIYLPPVHPIGRMFRKGKNNTLTPEPDDVGSPWAIGNENGGHTAIEPALGPIEDFDRFVRFANDHGMEVALDYALQCAPDHPWVQDHPEWFHVRPDGTIKYAENPPKKYQDIYPLNFWCDDREGLWNACRDVLFYWIGHGVKTFRVDNPHTKPFAFWEWVIDEVQSKHPDVIFLAEAFTRPKKMKNLAKLGFTQSYTYFTWKNTAFELREYLEEMTQTEMAEYFRGNFFVNTPDILHEYLQHGGPQAFRVRLLLASTLLPLYGIYSGYELYENVPVRPGSEEYMHSEKYEIRVRDWEAPGNLNPMIQRINRARRENPALQRYPNLQFHRSENDQILFYSKVAPDAGNYLLMVVNLDPHRPQETMVHVPLELLGLTEHEPYTVEDLLTGARYTWRSSRNYVRLDPHSQQAGHILRLERG
ncbi:MAG TPA: alpha-1,4-glucan--maltose-1-phosphate maltosyltransferase [Gemmatimonadaceae bacterium]|nr:alpha-1,4-glucan--maltose-1-phosphate maltosyltransferase [Gemmatimonadaceae bacterium]